MWLPSGDEWYVRLVAFCLLEDEKTMPGGRESGSRKWEWPDERESESWLELTVTTLSVLDLAGLVDI